MNKTTYTPPPRNPGNLQVNSRKRDFMVAYVLARAATSTSGLDGGAAAKEAAKAWAAIEQECK